MSRTDSEAPVALVTGANRGIGFEVCIQLALRGFRAVLAARTFEKAQRATATAESRGVTLVPIELDVTRHDTIPSAVATLLKDFGRIDVLVNNAALLLDKGEGLLELSEEGLRATFETNLFGAIAVAQAVVPVMLRQKDGRVVNVSSQAGQLSSMGTYAPAYSMSKAALNAFTRQLAAATRGSGVLVNSVCPGWVRTDMGGRRAPRSVEQGAEGIVWLATLPKSGPTGKFFTDRGELDW
jgi:NAD(P)-dependent dehydrogenase (short-subunit alcohol dehydrogenase family)